VNSSPCQEHGLTVERGQNGPRALGGQCERAEADLDRPGRPDLCAQGLGQELRAEADTERGAAAVESRRDGGLRGAQERVAIVVVHPDRSAEDDEQVGPVDGVRVELVDAGIEKGGLVAALRQQGSEDAEVFEGDVADGEGRSGGAGRGHALSSVRFDLCQK